MTSLNAIDAFAIRYIGSTAFAGIVVLGVAVVAFLHRNDIKSINLTVSDAAVLLFLTWQCIGIRYGIYKYNAVVYAVHIVTATGLYCLLRLAAYFSGGLRRYLLIALCSIGLSLAIINVPGTVGRIVEWDRLGLPDIFAFRANFSLAGGGTKTDSLMLALSILPFALLAMVDSKRSVRYLGTVTALGSSVVLALGLSRGVYLGWMVLCIAILVPALLLKRPLHGNVRNLLFLWLATLITIGVSYGMTTADRHGSISSRSESRSVSGRIEIWKEVMDHKGDWPLRGIGGGNVPLFYLSHPADPARPFIARTYNWMLELLVQSGVVGLCSFAALVVSSLAVSWRTIKHTSTSAQAEETSLICQGALIGLLVSDMTYTSTIRHPPVTFLVFILAGILNTIGVESSDGPLVGHRHLRWSFGIGCLLFAIASAPILVLGIRSEHAVALYVNARSDEDLGDYAGAVQLLAAAEEDSTCNALFASMRGLALAREAVIPPDDAQLWLPVSDLSPASREALQAAKLAFQSAAECAPSDAAFRGNLAWLDEILGNSVEAQFNIDAAIASDPNSAIYRVTRGLFYERAGEPDRAYDEYAIAIATSPTLLQSAFFDELSRRHPDHIGFIIAAGIQHLKLLADSPTRTAAIVALARDRSPLPDTAALENNVLAQIPNLPYPWITLASIDSAQGDPEAASLNFRRALFIDPANRIALEGLAETDRSIGNDPEALAAAEAAIMSDTPSEHARLSGRIYGIEPLTPNDIFPGGLLASLQPRIAINGLCDIVYQVSESHGGDVPPNVASKIRLLGGTC